MTTDSSKTSTRKTIILATGAWHPTHLYDPLKHALAAHKVDLIVPDLPTMGVEATGLTWEADVAALLAAAEPLFEQGREIAIMGHSYGGIPACVATRGNSVAERAAQGKKGGFNHFVLLCAFALPQRGVSLKGMLPGQEWLDWQEEVKRGDGREQIICRPHAKDLFYNDLPVEKAEATFATLVPQSLAAQTTAVDYVATDVHSSVPKTYIICDVDVAFPAVLQKQMADACGFRQFHVSGGHSAFMSVPEEVAKVLVDQVVGGGEPSVDRVKVLDEKADVTKKGLGARVKEWIGKLIPAWS